MELRNSVRIEKCDILPGVMAYITFSSCKCVIGYWHKSHVSRGEIEGSELGKAALCPECAQRHKRLKTR